MYLMNVIPWESSKWVAPPPEEIARIRKEAGTHDAALAEEGAEIQAQRSLGEIEPEQKDSLESGDTEAEKEGEHHEQQ